MSDSTPTCSLFDWIAENREQILADRRKVRHRFDEATAAAEGDLWVALRALREAFEILCVRYDWHLSNVERAAIQCPVRKSDRRRLDLRMRHHQDVAAAVEAELCKVQCMFQRVEAKLAESAGKE